MINTVTNVIIDNFYESSTSCIFELFIEFYFMDRRSIFKRNIQAKLRNTYLYNQYLNNRYRSEKNSL